MVTNELVYLARTENLNYAYELLLEKHLIKTRNSINSKILSNYYNLPITIEDLETIVISSIKKSVLSYNYSCRNSSSLSSWIFINTWNDCKNYIRKLSTKRMYFSNSMLSIDNLSFSKLPFKDLIASTSPQVLDYEASLAKIRQKISEAENNILNLKLEGYSNLEISKKLGIYPKKVANTYEKIKSIAKICKV